MKYFLFLVTLKNPIPIWSKQTNKFLFFIYFKILINTIELYSIIKNKIKIDTMSVSE